MMDEHKFFNIVQVTPVKDKMTRAQSIQGMMSMGLVKWPSFAPWFQRARREMLMFPNGKHDDFVDFVAHLGRGIHQMVGRNPVKAEPTYEPVQGLGITGKSLKEQSKKDKRSLAFVDR
jgi:hypothetical protein